MGGAGVYQSTACSIPSEPAATHTLPGLCAVVWCAHGILAAEGEHCVAGVSQQLTGLPVPSVAQLTGTVGLVGVIHLARCVWRAAIVAQTAQICRREKKTRLSQTCEFNPNWIHTSAAEGEINGWVSNGTLHWNTTVEVRIVHTVIADTPNVSGQPGQVTVANQESVATERPGYEVSHGH